MTNERPRPNVETKELRTFKVLGNRLSEGNKGKMYKEKKPVFVVCKKWAILPIDIKIKSAL